MLREFIVVVSVFAIWGCGMMANPQEEDKKLSAPQKVSMEMPKELQSNQQKTTKRLKKESNSSSIAYISLKEDIAQVEKNIVEVEQSLLFVNQVIGDIDTRCHDVELEHICKIDEDELSFIVDENLSKEINNSDYLVGDMVVFGEVEFIRYAQKEKYQYEIKFDNTFIDALSTETIKWSEDKREVSSIYIEESQEDSLSMKIDYQIKANGDQEIYIDDDYLDKSTNNSDILSLNILKKGDRDRYYEVSSDSKMVEHIDDQAEDSFFSTEGILSSDGGYLLFRGEFFDEEFREREIFDGSGELVESYYCISDMDCDMEDEWTWEE